MIKLPEDSFMFGTSCVPYALATDWSQEEWECDFKTIKSLNFTTVRIFAAWERIEISDGSYDFQKVDYALELAQKHQLNIIIQFGGMFKNYGGYTSPAWWGESTCPDFEPFRSKVETFMTQVVKRYASHPNLLGWMCWNEPESDNCKCEHTLGAYRQWLKEKYVTLDALNRAWSTMKTYKYNDWDAVGTGSSLVASADWLLFRQARLANLIKRIDAIVKVNDPYGHFTTLNIVNHFAALNGPYSVADFGVDVGSVAGAVDIVGFSFYHVEHSFDIEGEHSPMRHAYKQSRFRSVSVDPEYRTFVLETGAGPNVHQLTEKERTRLCWQMVGHNAKGILLWNYRSRISDGQVGLFNLVKWDGSVSRRAQAAAEFSKVMQRHAKLFNNVFPRHQAAVLTPELNQVMMLQLCAPVHTPETYDGVHLSRLGAFKMLWDHNVGADCLTEYQYDRFNDYKLILLPMLEHMTEELAEKLKAFVANGGTLIAESPFAFRDSQGFLQYHAPGLGLSEVFGCWTNDRENRETAPGMMYPDGSAKTCTFWSEYILTTGRTEVMYENGSNAVVSNCYGKGRTILAGTEIFRQYMREPQAAASGFFKQEIIKSVIPDAICAGNASDVEFLRLKGKPGVINIIINHNSESRTFVAKLRDGDSRWVNLLTDEMLVPGQPFHLSPEETLIIKMI